MRKPASWMQLPIDDRILETLDSSGLILSPAVLAINIDKSRDEVNRRLSVLVDYGVVRRVKRGYYEITDLGEQYLEGELDASELEEPADQR
nr:transcriptional regulator [Natrarchaeobius chitinivorans]